jgi:cytochrome c oxidase subunit 1/cytochrome c oxidase subunit I+III
MHIVGLDGMPRRVYTYPGGLGWGTYNLIETVGGFLTLAGILLLFGNLVASYFRGMPVGIDPWHGPTLEWTISSPPPEYNFAVIPRVVSAYPNWDPPQRGGEPLVLDVGHEQPVTSPADGVLAEIADMPHESPWPVLLALCLTVVFAMLVIEKFAIAGIALGLCAIVLGAWHWQAVDE